MTRLVIEGCAIATVDGDRTEHADGHIVVRHGFIDEVGAGPAPAGDEDEVRIDGRGMLATPGLVNCHHHLYQWATRGLAQDNTLFEWLQELYPIWAHVDAAIEQAAARAGLVALARSGCTTASDHHYLFPRDGGDLLGVEVDAARDVGLRFHPCRGSMDLGRSDGGLPPDDVVEHRAAILAASQDAIDRYHDPSPQAMVRIALAPCSPFSVTTDLMREAAALARDKGVRLRTDSHHHGQQTESQHGNQVGAGHAVEHAARHDRLQRCGSAGADDEEAPGTEQVVLRGEHEDAQVGPLMLVHPTATRVQQVVATKA